MMFPVRVAVACVAALVVVRKAMRGSANSKTTEETKDTETEEPAVTEDAVPQLDVNDRASEVSPSETRTQSTTTANDVAAETNGVEVTSKADMPRIEIDAVATGTDSLEVAPRKSSFSKLMKKVSDVIPSPRKQTA